jgi:hypothetical protein
VAEQDRGSDDPELAAVARHALHDEELVAAFAAGDVEDPADGERARALVERCSRCHDLHRDLVAIRAVIRASGTAAQRAETRAAPRDFRLSTEDAARIRPGSPAARLAVRLGWRARLNLGVATFGRPVGAAMATFGIVGLLVGSLGLGGGPFASMGGAAASTAAPAGVDVASEIPETSAYRASYGPIETARDVGIGGGPPGGEAGTTAPPLLFGGSIALVVVGIGLILVARRETVGIPAQRGN